jgi:hypothetical protein
MGVKDPLLEGTSMWETAVEWESAICGAWHSTVIQFICGAEPNVCGTALREVHMPYGMVLQVVTELLGGLVMPD